jgi:hypothetical protein
MSRRTARAGGSSGSVRVGTPARGTTNNLHPPRLLPGGHPDEAGPLRKARAAAGLALAVVSLGTLLALLAASTTILAFRWFDAWLS